jgi:multidrug resistance protein, MATE family
MKRNSSAPAGDGLRDHVVSTARLAAPVMLSRAGLVLMLTVDTLVVGHMAQADVKLSALGAALIPNIFLQAMAVGLLIGVIVHTAHRIGGGTPQACGQIWRMGVLIALGLGLAYAAILSLGPVIISTVLRQPPDVAEAGGPVLRVFGWGLPGLLVYIACAHFLEGINRPLPPMLLMFAANVLNAVLAYGLGYGAFGLPESGVIGVATATSIVRILLGIAAVATVMLSIDRAHYGVTLRHTQGFSGLGKLIVFGLPLGAAIGLESACFSLVVNMAGWLGKASLATMTGAINYTSFVYMLTIGLATAAAVRVGTAVGRGDEHNAQRAGWIAVAMVAIVMAGCGLLTAIFADTIARIVTNDPAVLAMLVPALAGAVSLLVVVDGLQGVLMGALRGHADTMVPTVIYAVSFWVVGVPAGYWWGYHHALGPTALLWALIAALAAATVALAWRFKYLPRRATA